MPTKLSLETINQSFGSSFTIRPFDKTASNVYPSWHFHPEIELTYIKGGSGRRHIGKHLSKYSNGDLLLIGPNLPHYGFTQAHCENEKEIVLQFNADFLGNDFLRIPEANKIRELLERAAYGISFNPPARKTIGSKIEVLSDIPPFKRLLAFVRILHEMAESDDYKLLNREKIKAEEENTQDEKLAHVFGIIRKDYHQEIKLEAVAEQANMTVPAFCRYFKKQSGKTFTQFINEYRIIHACKLLSDTTKMITEIAEESGYKNFSYFNRQFHKFTGKTPTQYRQEFKQLI